MLSLILLPLLVLILMFMSQSDSIFLVTVLLPDVTVVINGAPRTRPSGEHVESGGAPDMPRLSVTSAGSLSLLFLGLFRKTMMPPDFVHHPLSEACAQPLCFPPVRTIHFSNRAPFHSINMSLHLFLISLSDVFTKALRSTICPGQPARSSKRFFFFLDQNPLNVS